MKQSVVHLREGALAEIGAILDHLQVRRVLLVVDQRAYDASGAGDVLEPALAGRTVIRFSDFKPNPELRHVVRGIVTFTEARPDAVIALGGGTAIDLAKSISRLAGQHAPLQDIIRGDTPYQPSGPPLITIPTTAGTGSEATHFAVVYIDGVKYSFAHRSVRPDFAIVDPLLTHNLPASVTAASGLDALCQATESLWAVAATDESVAYAARAFKLALTHLLRAVHEPTPEARYGMSEAAHLAGQAINISRTTASHALSYAITMQYGVPHGFAVALTLVPLLRYNAQLTDSDCIDPRGSDHVRQRIGQLLAICQCSDVEAACDTLRALIEQVGGLVHLAQIGAASDVAIEHLARQVNAQRLSNNPRRLDENTLRQLLTSVR
ncbi:MAG: phosphonoacetaldehyde reductase [Pirellulales bacterium]